MLCSNWSNRHNVKLLPWAILQILFSIQGLSSYSLYCSSDPIPSGSERTVIQNQWNKMKSSYLQIKLTKRKDAQILNITTSWHNKFSFPYSVMCEWTRCLVSYLVGEFWNGIFCHLISFQKKTRDSEYSFLTTWDSYFCSFVIHSLLPKWFLLLCCHPLTITTNANWFCPDPVHLTQVEDSMETA